jgi:7-carboxy-7-deazaguanine synthase
MAIDHVIPTETALRARAPGTYVVNEVFYSIQGEGILAGEPMVFVRFSDCNLRCAVKTAGFDCDTEFMSGRELTTADLVQVVTETTSSADGPRPRVLFTGGEPSLQVDALLIDALIGAGFERFAIETNGTIRLPDFSRYLETSGSFDFHVCVSPKSAEHTLRHLAATEVKYVRHRGQALPQTRVQALHYLVSPAARPDGSFDREDVAWCVQLVKENPSWRLSLQLHKILGVR